MTYNNDWGKVNKETLLSFLVKNDWKQQQQQLFSKLEEE